MQASSIDCVMSLVVWLTKEVSLLYIDLKADNVGIDDAPQASLLGRL
jgi:hypothetical protein